MRDWKQTALGSRADESAQISEMAAIRARYQEQREHKAISARYQAYCDPKAIAARARAAAPDGPGGVESKAIEFQLWRKERRDKLMNAAATAEAPFEGG
jgi:hypothetical protein